MQDRDSLLREKAELEAELSRKEVEMNSKKITLNGTFRQAGFHVQQGLCA